MTDPFAMALGKLHNAAGSVAADYVDGDAAPVPIRIIRRRPDEVSPIGRGRIVQATNVIEIRKADVGAPKAGAIVKIGDEQLKLAGDPRSDDEGLTWYCPANVVP